MSPSRHWSTSHSVRSVACTSSFATAPGGHRCRWPRIHRAAEEDVRARADEARGRDLGRVQVDMSNGDPEGAKVRRHR